MHRVFFVRLQPNYGDPVAGENLGPIRESLISSILRTSYNRPKLLLPLLYNRFCCIFAEGDSQKSQRGDEVDQGLVGSCSIAGLFYMYL